MESGDRESAIAAFCHAVEAHPNHPQSYGNIGICYANMGRKLEALEAFDRALELDPKYEPALVNRKLAASLAEGQSLAGDVKSIEYYKDYPFQNRSYIEELAASQGPLPEKK